MKNEYDFSEAKRGAIANSKGKTRITIMLDDAVLEAARTQAEREGLGYQTVINGHLRRILLGEKRKNMETAHLKAGITHPELKSLEKKLNDAVAEIHRLMEQDAHP
ncbi:BrnA antitoxin family protein [Pseudomonas sp. PB3P13]